MSVGPQLCNRITGSLTWLHSFDFAPVYIDVAKAYESVEKWAAPKRAEFDRAFWVMGPKYKPEPKGLLLVVAPFNLPIFLTLSPLVRVFAPSLLDPSYMR